MFTPGLFDIFNSSSVRISDLKLLLNIRRYKITRPKKTFLIFELEGK